MTKGLHIIEGRTEPEIGQFTGFRNHARWTEKRYPITRECQMMQGGHVLCPGFVIEGEVACRCRHHEEQIGV